MRMRAATSLAVLVMMFGAEAALAHLLVDVKVSVVVPPFVEARQRFTYQVIADNLANDAAFGVVVTQTLPPSSTFVRASGSGWNCSQSQLKVTCSAETIGPGPNLITIEVTAPPAPGPIASSVTIMTLGSFDPFEANDKAAATTTVFDPLACPARAVELLTPADTTSPVRLSWSAVPNARSYGVYAAIEGERSARVGTTTEPSVSLTFEKGNVEWRVEADLGACPPASSLSGHFLSAGKPAALSLTPYASATLVAPAGLAVDSAGDLLVADSGNLTIRRVARGEVTTLSGTPSAAGAADGRPASFATPMGMTITPLDDFLFVADRGNDAVRLRYPGGPTLGYVITIGGAAGQPGMTDGLGGVSRFSGPSAVAGDPRGRLYVADTGNHRIRKMESVPGYTGFYGTATFAGSLEGSADGPVLATARFRSPAGIAIDGEDTIYVADTGNHTIRKISGGIVTTLAGLAGSAGIADGYGSDARFNAPTAIALDARGNLYVCDTENHTIRKVAPSGLVTTVAGGVFSPKGIAIDASGAIYISDTGKHRILIAHTARPRRRAVRF